MSERKNFRHVLPLGAISRNSQFPTRAISTYTVDGTILQNNPTSDFIPNMWEIVCHTRQLMTLLPGDVVSTDTSAGIGLGLIPQRFLQLGDVIDSGIDGLGKMHPGAPSLHP